MKLLTKNYFAFFIMMLISASMVLTTSCDKEDDKDAFVGTWEFEKAVATMGTVTEELTAADMGLDITFVAKDDGTFTVTSVYDSETETDSGTWKRVDDSTIEVTSDGETDTLKKDGNYYYFEEVDEEYGMTMKMYFKKV